ncbi:araC family transcriptional regulator [Planomonospora sphaerica]|uniref:AraC family transcriptional regulator n=1 Tax=Planomonospora sphaerica TaxID=161355 RepID=A0A171DN26_9ACTN|nr:helix-turn-helix domain-containing protein [Planomonospora sphaerica]GAT70460.1 araC family transcriptional regulator [Planomonospora sphaerica]
MAAFTTDGVSSFGVSAVSNVFADRSHLGLPSFGLTVCADGRGALRTDLGHLMEVGHGPEAMSTADLVIVLPTDGRPLTLREPVADAIRDAHGRGAIIAAYGTGSFLLAGTGLLDGRRATTDWRLVADLAGRHPRITVEPEVLYVDEGRLVTGAGAAAGIDMCLHLLRREHGTAVANAVAREAMVAPRRESGEVHYVPAVPAPPDARAAGGPRADDARMDDVLRWSRTRLHQAMSVDDLARHALMSPRTFARRFREVTGTTPHAWLRDQRLDRAEELLETTDLPIQEIADRVGFRSDGVLRDHFVKRHGVPPRDYRRVFGRRREPVTRHAPDGRLPR